MTDEQILVDPEIVRRVLRRKGAAWLGAVVASTAVLSGIALMFVPQSFTATTSVAVQTSSSGAGGALMALAGAETDTKRYIGVLKSRMAAKQVEQAVHLRDVYNLKTEDDAIDMLIKGVKPDDNATDGLLYINVSLPGPAKLQPAGARRNEVKRLAAIAANRYAAALRTYYAYNDTDRDSVLLRGADEELQRARANYKTATAQLRDFVTGLRNVDPRAATLADSDNAAAGSGEIGKLYEALAQVETQISSVQAGYGTERQMVQGQLQSIANIPAEDPLLTSARQAVAQDKIDLRLLRAQYGDSYPSVVRAKERLAADEDQLSQQMTGIRDSKTSRQVSVQAQLVSLQARRAVLQRQVYAAEKHLNIGRRLGGNLLEVKTEWQLALGALKTATEETEKVRVQNAAAQSRVAVVDVAQPPKNGSPGILVIVALSLVLALLCAAAAFIRAYMAEAHRISASAFSAASPEEQPLPANRP